MNSDEAKQMTEDAISKKYERVEHKIDKHYQRAMRKIKKKINKGEFEVTMIFLPNQREVAHLVTVKLEREGYRIKTVNTTPLIELEIGWWY